MKNKIIKIFSIVSAIMFSIANIVYADQYGIYNVDTTSGKGVIGAGQYIAGWILYAGIIICVIALMIKGIKFITSAPEGKADVKKSLIPWAVGLIILVAGRVALNWIIDLTQSEGGINNIDADNVGYVKNIFNITRL